MGEPARAITHSITPEMEVRKWKPGESGNPTGRPKGGIGLASYIREHTLDGRELADFLLGVMRGDSNPFCKMTDRLKACEMLIDRAFGKISGPTGERVKEIKPVLDLDKLTTQEVYAIEQFGLVVAAIRERLSSDSLES
jgi:hypothetical protein